MYQEDLVTETLKDNQMPQGEGSMGNNVDCGGSESLYLFFVCLRLYRLKRDMKSVALSMLVMWRNLFRN